ncbi:MAG: DUF4249 domain-containing protein [Sphingobacteriaceae bacterium]|nr:MAG: DUF4249 domain-containing protein [Sphingobacteriaceae bacterium]
MKLKYLYTVLLAVLAIVSIYSCQKKVDIKATSTNYNILVVEGLINIADSTKIKLSRTVVLGNKTTASPEGGATISIETTQATVATLQEKTKGTYVTPVLNLDKTKQYRLRIKTTNGKTYLSDLVDAKITPPIDSLGYTFNDRGMLIHLNSHDDTNNSRYYLYNFTETWMFHADHWSQYITNGSSLVPRTQQQQVYYCFNNDTSKNVITYSTAALTRDVVNKVPITTIDYSSKRMQVRYSIMVTQTALTKDAYTFWENMKTGTETLGSIFDTQPSTIPGNIHNIADLKEPVIGYIGAGTIQSKRIFIDKNNLPSTFKFVSPNPCQVDSARNDQLSKLIIPNSAFPLYTIEPYFVNGNIAGYLYTTKECADCTLTGKVKQPSFWQ